MIKRIFEIILILVLSVASIFGAVSKTADLSGGVYAYMDDHMLLNRFAFSLGINTENETFWYCESIYSSYIGNGQYTVEKGILKIIESRPGVDGEHQVVNLFKIEKDALVFIAEGSDNFTYVHLPDSATFHLIKPEQIVY